MTSQTFTIGGKMPGMNQYTNALAMHRFKGRKMKDEETLRVCWAIKAARIHHVNPPIYLKIKFYEPNKRRDKDNIAAFANKCIFDALQEAHIIDNDNWKWVEGFQCEFDVDNKEPRIEVTIIEV